KLLYCNSYLLRLEDDSGKKAHVLIDPGGAAEFPQVSDKTLEIIGSWKKLAVVSANHQDPDVIGSLPLLANRLAPHALVFMTEDTWRLVALTGIPRDRVRFVERYGGAIKLASLNRVLKIIPSPYCHFTGAFLIFEPRSGCLFTGDLFAGVSLDESMYPLEAEEGHWSGIRFFHERYMPTNTALRWIVGKIRQLEGLEMICPQHGSIIPKDLIPEFLDRMENLQVGADLLDDRELDDHTRSLWNQLAQRLIDVADEILGVAASVRIAEDPQLMDLAHFEGNRVVIDKLHRRFVEGLVAALTEKEVPEISNRIITTALIEADRLGLGTLAVDLALDEPGAMPAMSPPERFSELEIEAD
ncbi:MAG: hypothetical protein MI919_01625, partial [Holophagales bacterium]|nr:hypothetical protein [Holophagales bacterium]